MGRRGYTPKDYYQYLLNGPMWVRKTIAPGLLAISLIATGVVGYLFKRQADKTALSHFHFTTAEVQRNIVERLRACEQILLGGAALFNASHQVERNEWQSYVDSVQIDKTLAGIQGVGYAELVPGTSIAEHERAIRAEGFPDYRLWPAGTRNTYTAIIYLEPFLDRNLRAFGYDMFAEPVRQRAMQRACDEHQAALSGKVTLVQETNSEVQAGTLLYYPVYRRGAPVNTIEERRLALQGWVYSPYRMTQLITGALHGWRQILKNEKIHFQIFDSESPSPECLLFGNTQDVIASPNDRSDLVQLATLDYAGSRWTLQFTQTGGLAAVADYGSTWFALGTGVTVSGLIFCLTLSLQRTGERSEKRAEQLTQELRQAAERLALATRTGGVGVWEYDIVRNHLVWDEQMFKVYGLTRDRFGGTFEFWLSTVHPDDKTRITAEIRQALDGQAGYDSEFRIHWPDGSTHHIRAFGVVEQDGSGRAVRMIGTNWDITEGKLAEEAVKKSGAQLSMAMSLAHLAYWEMDAGSGLFTFNDAFYSLYGTTAEKEGGYHMSAENYARTFLPPEQQHLVATNAGRLLAGEIKDVHLEHRIIRRDGAIRSITVKAAAFYDSAGRITGLYGANQDITELREKEQQLSEQHTRWREALLATMDGYLETDQDGTILEVNPAYEHLSGYTTRELTGRNIANLEAASTADDLSRHREIRQLGSTRFRTRHQRKDGGLSLLEVSATFSPRFGGRYYYFYRDITNRQETERQLQLQKAALEAAANTIVITNAGGKIEWVNEAFVRATGYSREEAYGQNPRILKSGQHPPDFYDKMWTTILAGSVWRGELVNRRKDGVIVIEEATITPVLSPEGRITHFVAIKHDITDRKNLERQLLRSQRMEAIGLLAGGIAHDLNNILTPILLGMELLKPCLAEAEDREMLDRISLTARRGAGVVKQVLTFARGIEGERLPHRPIDLIRELVDMIEETFPRDIRICR